MIAQSAGPRDRFSDARSVADAVLYEGYVLYPYRASSAKNQLRWQFGVLAPAAVAADGSERSALRTEVIVAAGPVASLTVRVRLLQVQRRSVEKCADHSFVAVAQLDVDGTRLTQWEEAVEHEFELGPIDLQLPAAVEPLAFELPPSLAEAEVRDRSGAVVGRTIHRRDAVQGVLRVDVSPAPGAGGLLKVVASVTNTVEVDADGLARSDAMLRSLVAVHTLLAVDGGAFVSLLDPPESEREAVAGCHNDGTFPVLIGATDDVMLSSPIILYDHPAIAPESAGDFCDATEIDEILALRVLTLTDEEKAEARGTDARAAAIIDRCDDMPPELWARLHGAIRSLDPLVGDAEPALEPDTVDPFATTTVPWWDPGVDAAVDPWTDSIIIAGTRVAAGTRVRLRPSRRADAQDLFYDGLPAVVKGVFRDVDGDQHVAVALDDDPIAHELEWQGRYLYFHPDEIEVLS